MQWEDSTEDETTMEDEYNPYSDASERHNFVDSYENEEVDFEYKDVEEYEDIEEIDSQEEYDSVDEGEESMDGPNGGEYVEEEFSPDEEEYEEEDYDYKDEEVSDSSEDFSSAHYHPVGLPQLDSFAAPAAESRFVRTAEKGRYQSSVVQTTDNSNDILLLGGISIVGVLLMYISRRNRQALKMKLSE